MQPTALIRLHELIEEGIVAPALVIGVPVGFVNVVEAKELFIGGDTPYISSREAARAGGSNVAASIVMRCSHQMVHREGFSCCRKTTVCRQEERTAGRSKVVRKFPYGNFSLRYKNRCYPLRGFSAALRRYMLLSFMESRW